MPVDPGRTASGDDPSNNDALYEQLRKELAALRRDLESVSETAYSEDGLVTVTIGPRGDLQKLVLDPRIYRITDANALAASIIATVREASAAVTRRIIALTEPLLPEDMRGMDGERDIEKARRSVTGPENGER